MDSMPILLIVYGFCDGADLSSLIAVFLLQKRVVAFFAGG